MGDPDARTADDGLPPLRDVIARTGLSARKSLGQNFLLDLNLTRKIARAAGALGHVVEVGPGPGGLTRALLMEGALKVTAIERDERCRDALEEIAARWPGRLDVHWGDATEVDFAAIGSASSTAPRVVANLPYNVGTALLVSWMTTPAWPPWWSSLTLMFQREVAERVVAAPGSKAYGRLAVLTQWRARPRIVFDVGPQAFTPPPKVTSSVLHIEPRPTPTAPCGLAELERVTAAAFGQRRKMLRASLKALGGDTAELLERAGASPEARAETIDVSGFAAIARALKGT